MFHSKPLMNLKRLFRDKCLALMVLLMIVPHPSVALLGFGKKNNAETKQEASQPEVVPEQNFTPPPAEPKPEPPRAKTQWEKDRDAIIEIRSSLEAMFLGNDPIFADEDNDGVRRYIDFLLRDFEQFIFYGKRPQGLRMLPVAGPSATMKSLIFTITGEYLIRKGLLDKNRYYFEQAENGMAVTLAKIIDMGVDDEVINGYVNEDTPPEHWSTSTYSSNRKIVRQQWGLIGQDEASHKEELPDTWEEFLAFRLRQLEFEVEGPETDEPPPEEPKEPVRGEEDYAAKMAQYSQDLVEYEIAMLAHKAKPVRQQVSAKQLIEDAKLRAEAEWNAKQQITEYKTDIWMATSGRGEVFQTKPVEVDPAIKQKLENLEMKIAAMTTELEGLELAADSSAYSDFRNVPRLRRANDELVLEMRDRQKELAALEAQVALFNELTPTQVYSWLRTTGHLKHFQSDDFNPSEYAEDAQIYEELLYDIYTNTENFRTVFMGFRKTAKNVGLLLPWRTFSQTRNMIRRRNLKSRPLTDRNSRRHEKSVSALWEDNHIRLLKKRMDEELAKSVQKGRERLRGEIRQAERRIEENNAEMAIFAERFESMKGFREYAKSHNFGSVKDAVSAYNRLLAEMDALLDDAAFNPDSGVQQAIESEIMGLSTSDLSERFPEHYRYVTQVLKRRADQYLSDLKRSKDSRMMHRELVKMSPELVREITIKMLKDGGFNRRSKHYGFAVANVMNVKKIEAAVEERLPDGPVDWETYANAYQEVLESEEFKNWAFEFYKAYYPELIKDDNFNASLRRLLGKTGEIFLEPPGPKRVANQGARAIMFSFDKWQNNLKRELMPNMNLTLHLDRNVGMALVSKRDNARLGLDPVLERVNGLMASLQGPLQVLLKEMASKPESANVRGHLAIVLEQSDNRGAGARIALRWLPPGLKLRGGLFDPNNLPKGFELPENSLIHSIPVNMGDDLYFKGLSAGETSSEPRENFISIIPRTAIVESERIGRTAHEDSVFAAERAKRQRALMEKHMAQKEEDEMDEYDEYAELPELEPGVMRRLGRATRFLNPAWYGKKFFRLFVKPKEKTEEEVRKDREYRRRQILRQQAIDAWNKLHFSKDSWLKRMWKSYGIKFDSYAPVPDLPDYDFVRFYIQFEDFRNQIKNGSVTSENYDEYFIRYKEWAAKTKRWKKNLADAVLAAELEGAEPADVLKIEENFTPRPTPELPCGELLMPH